jgi:hypothetical protein
MLTRRAANPAVSTARARRNPTVRDFRDRVRPSSGLLTHQPAAGSPGAVDRIAIWPSSWRRLARPGQARGQRWRGALWGLIGGWVVPREGATSPGPARSDRAQCLVATTFAYSTAGPYTVGISGSNRLDPRQSRHSRLSRSGCRQRHRAALGGGEGAQRPGAGPESELVVPAGGICRQRPQHSPPVPRAGQHDALGGGS